MAVSDYVVAAIVGCWRWESGVNPGIWESLIPCAWDYEYEYKNKGGYGFGQWTNVGTSHGRCWNLHEYVTSHTNSQGRIYGDGSGDGELAFMTEQELYWNGETGSGNHGDHSRSRGSYGSLTAFLSSTSRNLNTLVWDFLANWEGVPGDRYSERCEYARDALTYIQNHKNDGSSAFSWTSKNNYLTLSQTHANEMRVWYYFNGEYSPTDPSDPDSPDPSDPTDPSDPDPVPSDEDSTSYLVTLGKVGAGTITLNKRYYKVGDTVSFTAVPDEGETDMGWYQYFPVNDFPSIILTDEETHTYEFTMPASDVVLRWHFSGDGYSHTRMLILKCKKNVKLRLEIDTQDGATQTHNIDVSVDEGSTRVYTFSIGITDPVRIYCDVDEYKVELQSLHVGSWSKGTEDYFFYMPDINVYVLVIGTDKPEEDERFWWMSLRPSWTYHLF